MKKLILFFFILSTSSVQGSIKSQIVSNLISTDSLKFRFEQKISEKVETGECIIHYPKKIFCEYDDFYRKVLVSNGKSLLINSNRNNQYYRYSLDKTPLNLILDKEFIISKINSLNKEAKINELYKFKLDYQNLDIVIYFDEKTLNLVGWTTIDIYQNKVETKLSDIETNVFVDEEKFVITNYTN